MRGVINDTLYQTPEGDIKPMAIALAESDESELVLRAGIEGRFVEGLFTADDGDEYLVPEEYVDVLDDVGEDSPEENEEDDEDEDLPDEDDVDEEDR